MSNICQIIECVIVRCCGHWPRGSRGKVKNTGFPQADSSSPFLAPGSCIILAKSQRLNFLICLKRRQKGSIKEGSCEGQMKYIQRGREKQ